MSWLKIGAVSICIDPTRDDEGKAPPEIIALSAPSPERFDSRSTIRLMGPATVVLGHPAVLSRLRGNLLAVFPGRKKSVLGVEVLVEDGGQDGLRYKFL